VLGAIVTVIALLLGYPVAITWPHALARQPLLLVPCSRRCWWDRDPLLRWMILIADRGLINATLVEAAARAAAAVMYNRFGVAVAARARSSCHHGAVAHRRAQAHRSARAGRRP